MLSENKCVPRQKKNTERMYSKSMKTMTGHKTTECTMSSLAGTEEQEV